MPSENATTPTVDAVEAAEGACPAGSSAAPESDASATNTPPDVLARALTYAQVLHWHVFPCGADKSPLTRHGFKDATTDASQIRAWWAQHPIAQIGVACGASGLVVVDLDAPKGERTTHGRDAFAELRGMEPSEDGAAIATTPRGGEHRVYKSPADRRWRTTSNARMGIDVRAVGGYIVAPSGDPCRQWVEDCNPIDEIQIENPPRWLVEWLDIECGPAPETGTRTYGTLRPSGTAGDERLLEVQCALDAIPPTLGRKEGWIQAIFAAKAALDGDERGAELVESWSARAEPHDERTGHGQYKPGEPYRTYASSMQPWKAAAGRHLIDAETLFALADQHGPGWRDRWHELRDNGATATATEQPSPPASAKKKEEVPFSEALAGALNFLGRAPDIASVAGRVCEVVRTTGEHVLRTVPLGVGHLRERLASTPFGSANVLNALTELRGRWPHVLPLADPAPVRDWLDVANDPPMSWLAQGIIPRGGGIVLFGARPNTGKTFGVLDIVLRLAHGMPRWLDVDLCEGGASALYLAGEGWGGIPARLAAWRDWHRAEHPAPGKWVSVRNGIPPIATPEGVERLLAMVGEVADLRGAPPDVLVLDTWATATAGADESDAGAMGPALGALQALQTTYGTTAVALHHLRKVGVAPGTRNRQPRAAVSLDDLRGSGALAGAAETVLALDEGAVVTLKGRDAARCAPMPYRLVPYGDSAVFVPGEAVEPEAKPAVDPEAERAQRVAATRAEHEALVREVVRIIAEEFGGVVTSLEEVYPWMTGQTQRRRDAARDAIRRGLVVKAGRGNVLQYSVAGASSPPPAPPYPIHRGEDEEPRPPADIWRRGEDEEGEEDEKSERSKPSAPSGTGGRRPGRRATQGQTEDDGRPRKPGGRRPRKPTSHKARGAA